MKKIVRELAKVNIPERVLQEADMPSLLKSFEEDSRKLGDFKEARKKHGDRSGIGRWWHKSELKDAQLNAVELQASFSQKLGQLLTITIYMSKELNDQQGRLKGQQDEIAQNTQKLNDSQKDILRHQDEIKEQQSQSNKMIEDYFELKGLTADGARKLIEISKEIETTKNSLLDSFDQSVAEVRELVNDSRAEREEARQLLKNTHQSIVTDLEQQNIRMMSEMDLVRQGNDSKINKAMATMVDRQKEHCDLTGHIHQSFEMRQKKVTEELSVDLKKDRVLHQTEQEIFSLSISELTNIVEHEKREVAIKMKKRDFLMGSLSFAIILHVCAWFFSRTY